MLRIKNSFACSAFFVAATATLAQSQQPVSQVNAEQQAPTMVYNLPSQPVGVDDLLAISVYDSPELSRTVRVGADGKIHLPMLKERIDVKGMLPGDIETAIASRLQEEAVLVDPVVTVSVADYKSRPISVVGEVKQPTTFQAQANMTLVDAIARAEGFTDEAGDKILVIKTSVDSNGVISKLNMSIPIKELMSNADSLYNLKLTGNEDIRVPSAGRIFILGNVKQPGAIRVHETTQATVLKAIALTQGLAPYASKTAYVYRKSDGGKEPSEIPVELSKIMDRKIPDFTLEQNDILYVPDNKGRRMTLGALEKTLMIGSGLGGATIYAMSR